MAKLSNLKRIIKEDFAPEYQELIDKLSYSLNPYLEQVSDAFNKNITIENLSREYSTVVVEVVGGIPKTQTQIKTSLRSRLSGIIVINAENITNPATYPTGAPFITWSMNANIITVKHVTGLPDNNKYRLTLEILS